MAANEAAEKLYGALNEGSDALIDAVRAANDRGHRFTTALIEQAQESQRDAVELTKKWAEAPFDFLGLLSSLSETTTKAQGRALDATRQWFGEMADAQKETRDLIQHMLNANRAASEAGVDMARGMFSRATEAVTAATDGNGRRTAREAAKATTANSDD